MEEREIIRRQSLKNILAATKQDYNIEELLQLAFEELTSALSDFLVPNKSVFLKRENDILSIKNLQSEFLPKKYYSNKGQCFCNKLINGNEINKCDGLGNYVNNLNNSFLCIPIQVNNVTEVAFILHISELQDNTVTIYVELFKSLIESLIDNKIKQVELRKKAEQQNVLNQKLFAQSIEIDQKNIEIEEHERKIKEQFEELRQNNEEILAGINYASLLQKSMLTSEDLINDYLSEYFLIYKPKDIVSGDFYYINKIENQLILSVADCTGHGVSGAFITILGITYLHDTITRKEIYLTSTVLEIIRERFNRTFKTFGSDSQNGMDIALCALNLDTLVLQYSGANLALWIVRNGNLIEKNPTHCPIGVYPVEIDFQQNEIQMVKNDIVYLFSDGILDQLSEINFKKYKRKKFRKLILENSKLSMENQKQKILDNFENWKGKNEQTDDIVVLGFKI